MSCRQLDVPHSGLTTASIFNAPNIDLRSVQSDLCNPPEFPTIERIVQMPAKTFQLRPPTLSSKRIEKTQNWIYFPLFYLRMVKSSSE